jgi:hypothetical protein
VPSDKVQVYDLYNKTDILAQGSGIRNFSKSLHFLNQGAPNKPHGGVTALSSWKLSWSKNPQPFVKCEGELPCSPQLALESMLNQKLSTFSHISYPVIAPPPSLRLPYGSFFKLNHTLRQKV